MDRYLYFSPLGTLEVCVDGQVMVGLGFNENCNQKRLPSGEVKLWLDRFFDGKKPSVEELTLGLSGTEFQQRVWKALLDIPYGTVVSYGEIARRLEKSYGYKKVSPRAVGGAVHNNPIAIVVPCHRVVGADGKLVGYAYGTDIKQKLIDFEKLTK